MTPVGAEVHSTHTKTLLTEMTRTFHKTVTIKAVDEENRTATGAVLVPDEVDHQGEFLRRDAVECFHSDDPETGVMHSAFPEDAAEFERLEVIDEAEAISGEEFPAGTLVGTRHYTDDELWQLVDDGILTGFSIGGDVEDAAEHDSVPDDVRIPDGVAFEREDGVVELLDGEITEVSDVDIPAVPRATYKGTDLGKAILDEVEGEAEFVELLTTERGHSESEARRLYDYLTDVRDGKARKGDPTRENHQVDPGAGVGYCENTGNEFACETMGDLAGDCPHCGDPISHIDDEDLKTTSVGKPLESPQGAEFEDFEDCVDTLLADGDLEREEAEAVCGAWQDESKNKVEVNGSEVDLTPPGPVVNAAEAALDAKERLSDEIGDCGSGVGEDRARAIIDNDLTPEDFVGGENTAIPDYLDSHSEDVDGIDQPPTDWDDETWTDGCGPVQYALWGGTATGTGLEWANATEQELREAMDTENMADTDDGIDDATKLQVIKSWLTGSDDADAVEAPDATKADDEDDEMDEDEDDDEDKHATAGDTADSDMTDNDTDKSDDEPPEWAKSLMETVEENSTQIDELAARNKTATIEVGDEEVELTEKQVREAFDLDKSDASFEDAPPWAQKLHEQVEKNADRIETISKQSGHSQQLDGTGADGADGDGDEVAKFKRGLVGGQ